MAIRGGAKTMFRFSFILALVASMLCAGAAPTLAAQTLFLMNSQPGDYIGAGLKKTYTAGGNTFTAAVDENGTLNVQVANSQNTEWWYLYFKALNGKRLAPGLYDLAYRWPFQSEHQAGLSVSGSGRGCNMLTGRFLVSEIETDAGGKVTRLAIDLEQWCDNSAAPLFASLRIGSDIAVTPRVSVSGGAALRGNSGTSDAPLRVSLSMPAETDVSVRYATRDGTAVQGADYISQLGQVVFHPGETAKTINIQAIGRNVARGDRALSLNLSSGTIPFGQKAAELELIDPNSPITALAMNSDHSEWVGQGKSWLMTSKSTGLQFVTNYFPKNGFYAVWGRPQNWNVSIVPPRRGRLVPGHYEGATRYPFQAAENPGLDISGDGRGCNTLTGSFDILEAAFAADGSVQKFAADIEQHCEGQAPALFAWFRVNSILRQASITNARILQSSAVFTVTLSPPSNVAQTVQFTTADGTARAGVDYDAVARTIVFEPGETEIKIAVPLLPRTHAGAQFSGRLTARQTAIWITEGVARLQ